MKKTYRLIAPAIVLVLVTIACGFSVSTANLKNAMMASDSDGKNQTTTFSPNDTFYLIVDLANAPDDTTVKASWTAVEAANTDPNTFIDEATLTTGSDTLTFNLANDSPWPAGKYKVDLYLNDKLDQTIEFEVQ